MCWLSLPGGRPQGVRRLILSGARIHAEAGEIFAGTRPAPVAETTVFKSVGLAIEDLATARLVHDAVRARRSGGA
jgi:ornithine cyclodeaminase/alanine dehydrogenase-like protein (mu-crystallin family)